MNNLEVRIAKGLVAMENVNDNMAEGILNRFKALKMVDGLGGVNNKQVAEFYGMSEKGVESIWNRRRETLQYLGSKKLTHKQAKSLIQCEGTKINSQGIVIHSAKSVLFMAFHLEDNSIADMIVDETLSRALGEIKNPSVDIDLTPIAEALRGLTGAIETIFDRLNRLEKQMHETRSDIRNISTPKIPVIEMKSTRFVLASNMAKAINDEHGTKLKANEINNILVSLGVLSCSRGGYQLTTDYDNKGYALNKVGKAGNKYVTWNEHGYNEVLVAMGFPTINFAEVK